jgi:adenosine deaminase
MGMDLDSFVRALPKAELHLHIEGTLEPELMFELAERNGIELPYGSVDELRAAYEFTDLQSFLDIYYQGAAVLITEQDFADLMSAYLTRASADGVRHAEIFFDAQTHTERGIGFPVFMDGFAAAQRDAEERLGISSSLILCFLRHLSGEDALDTLEAARPYLDRMVGVGLDSGEVGNPPERFAEVFEAAHDLGLRRVAHAGEEGPPAYIQGALDVLAVERIDHGVRVEEDAELVERVVAESIPLTMCPLSNLKLQVVEALTDHNLKRLLDRGVKVTINSDDPAYFGGYIGDNYLAVAEALGLSRGDVVQLARNSIEATFLPNGRREALLIELEQFIR